MSFIGNAVRASLFGLALVAAPALVSAQEISQSQFNAALDVVKSSKSSRGYDSLLPYVATQVEDRLIALRPDLHKEIVTAVEAAALKLSSRRVDLDADFARLWAKNFSEDELKTIATFFKTTAGQKFADVQPAIVLEQGDVAKKWSERLGEELLDKSREELKNSGVNF